MAETSTVKKNQFITCIHNKAMEIARRYKTCEIELIEILEQVDKYKIYYQQKFSSLFAYATESLGLSSEVAYIYINIARKSREVPELKLAIKNGELSVTKARKMTSVLNSENKDYWLDLAKTQSRSVLEKYVAAASPRSAVREQMTYIPTEKEIRERAQIVSLPTLKSQTLNNSSEQPALTQALDEAGQRPVIDKLCPSGSSSAQELDQSSGLMIKQTIQVRVQLQVGISEKLMLDIRRVQDVLSQKRQKSVSLEEALEAMAKIYLSKEDPLEKAKRQKIRGKLPIHIDKLSDSEIAEEDGVAVESKTEERIKAKIKAEAGAYVKTEARTKVRAGAVEAIEAEVGRVGVGVAAAGIKLQTKSLSKKSNINFMPGQSMRQLISAETKHQLQLKYNGQCSYVDVKGQRCRQRRFLHIHHIHEVAKGGTNNINNLRLLCSGHHKLQHIK